MFSEATAIARTPGSCMGLLLLDRRAEVASIDDQGADLVTTTGGRQRFRRRPLPAGTVSLWDLARQNGGAA